MNSRIFAVIGVVIAIAVGITVFSRGSEEQTGTSGDSRGLRVSQNALYVADQLPSKAVSVALVYFEKPGFVVIHENTAAAPGSIVGVSDLFGAGESESPAPIELLRETEDGETIYAMIHLDDGDGIFSPAKDMPARDQISGEPVMMIVSVSAEAVEPAEVSL